MSTHRPVYSLVPNRVWHNAYRVEKSGQSLYVEDNSSVVVDLAHTGGQLKRGKLFCWIVLLFRRISPSTMFRVRTQHVSET